MHIWAHEKETMVPLIPTRNNSANVLQVRSDKTDNVRNGMTNLKLYNTHYR